MQNSSIDIAYQMKLDGQTYITLNNTQNYSQLSLTFSTHIMFNPHLVITGYIGDLQTILFNKTASDWVTISWTPNVKLTHKFDKIVIDAYGYGNDNLARYYTISNIKLY